MKEFGIDISYWQKGYPYDEANKEGIKFAIIRAGFRKQKDSVFEEHYANAKRLGWDVGAYWYSYATSVKEAEAEAKMFVKSVAGKKFEYPLYLDLEDSSQRGLGKELLGEMVEAFGKVIEDAGYYFGVYTNLDWYRNVIDGANLNKRFDWWIAAWNKTAPTNVSYGLWQFGGSTNKIRDAKIAGVVTDQNYAYKDYPSIMREKGLNGYSKEDTTEPETPKKTTEELANEVIQGLWGNGQERVDSLTAAGYDYDTVQNRVNELLAPTTLKVGDRVVITGTGNASSNGNGSKAYGQGWTREIMHIWTGRAYPYQVGANGVTTGFYKASALRKV